MIDNSSILGCYVSITSGNFNDDEGKRKIASEQGKLFRKYIWGETGVCDSLSKLRHEDYGKDLMLVLFQFYVNPLPIESQSLKAIDNYRKKEKSISIPIIVNNDNFFSKIESERIDFIKNSILSKINLLDDLIKKKKLDTNIQLLRKDIESVL